jgi:hypothetical protein
MRWGERERKRRGGERDKRELRWGERERKRSGGERDRDERGRNGERERLAGENHRQGGIQGSTDYHATA